MVRLVPPLVPPPLCPPPLLPAQGLSLTHSQLNSSQPNPLLSPSEAVLILTLHGPPLFPTSLLHTFGGVRSLRLIDPSTFIVEYWDERDAERAAEVLEGKTVGTTRLRCSFEPSVASTGMPVVQVESQVQPQVYRSPARRSQGQEPFGSIGNTLEARTRSYAPRSQGVKGGKSSQVDGYTSPVRFSPSVTNGGADAVHRSRPGRRQGTRLLRRLGFRARKAGRSGGSCARSTFLRETFWT